MRFMIIVKATPQTETGDLPDPEIGMKMLKYHEELARAGALLDASGLHPTSRGWRIQYSRDRQVVMDGPFTESKELIAGYTLIQVKSREEALEWAHRFPNPAGEGREAHIEVRQLYELDELGSGEWVDRFRDLMGGG